MDFALGAFLRDEERPPPVLADHAIDPTRLFLPADCDRVRRLRVADDVIPRFLLDAGIAGGGIPWRRADIEEAGTIVSPAPERDDVADVIGPGAPGRERLHVYRADILAAWRSFVSKQAAVGRHRVVTDLDRSVGRDRGRIEHDAWRRRVAVLRVEHGLRLAAAVAEIEEPARLAPRYVRACIAPQ